VRPELAEDTGFRHRFAREITAARRVNGAFTAGVVDADPHGSPAWLATVYVPGISLGDAVAAHGPWPQERVLALGAGLAEALEVIHAARVVHRDLKPSNVLLAADGPRVIDFGISVADESSALTRSGMVVGSPGFMSPEQITGKPVGPASDVFSLGAVLAFTATGAGPFGAGLAHAVNFRAVYEEPDLQRLPSNLRTVVAKCLAKDPLQRLSVPALLEQLSATHGDRQTVAMSLAEGGWLPESVAATLLMRSTELQVQSTSHSAPFQQAGDRARPTDGSRRLEAGDDVSLTKRAPDLTTVIVALSWDARTLMGRDLDVDASAILVGANGKVVSNQHFVFFNNRTSPEGSVEHLTVGLESDEKIKINLVAVPAEVTRIVFSASIYDAENRQQTFDDISQASIRVINQSDNREMTHYSLSGKRSKDSAVLLGELYRHDTDWRFRVISRGYASGLRGIALDFGVHV
jgi:stress response protein SCP2